MESILIKDLYAPDIKTIAETGDCTVYRMENESGYGRITRYPIYPGIELLYNDMHMEGCRQDKQPRRGVMEINHCRAGRFECEFLNGAYAYLGEGDLAINMLTNKPVESCFPLSHYHGISVIVDLAQGAKTLSLVSAALGGISMDLYAIRDRLCGGNTCFVMRTGESIQHIFSELYTAPEHLKRSYFKLKILELLLFLGAVDPSDAGAGRPYFYQSQVAVIKEIKEYMTANLDRRFTLNELSRRFHLPLTSMKLCFKGVYGSPIYTYMLSYRIQTAAMLLRQTGDSVTAIGLKVGYSNCGKFSAAFKKIMNISPTEYRNKYCLTGANRV